MKSNRINFFFSALFLLWNGYSLASEMKLLLVGQLVIEGATEVNEWS